MKKIWSLFLLFSFCLWAQAQSYDQLWSDVSKASSADLPKSALSLVSRIQTKAFMEGNDAQMLKSSLAAMACGVEINPDSVNRYINRMEEALSREKRPLEIALWHSALAQVYAAYDDELRRVGISPVVRDTKCEEHFNASLQYPELLIKIRYTDFLPLFAAGSESDYFNNDLLHVFYKAYEKSNRFDNREKLNYLLKIIPLYRQQGNRQAVLLLTLEYLDKINDNKIIKGNLEDNRYYQGLARLATEFSEQPANVQTYLALAHLRSLYDNRSSYAAHNDSLLVQWAKKGYEYPVHRKQKKERIYLKNFIEKVYAPQLEFGPMSQVYYPGTAIKIPLQVRNLKQLQLRVTRIFDSSLENDKADDKMRTKVAHKRRKFGVNLHYTLPESPARWHSRQIDFSIPRIPGVYSVDMIVDKEIIAREIFHVSTLRPMVFSTTTDSRRVVVVDSRTGYPVPHVTLTACQTDGKQQLKVYESADGTFNIRPEERMDKGRTYYLTTSEDQGACSFTLPGFRYYVPSQTEAPKGHIDLFTDRAIYRPGQEVGFSGVAYSRDGDQFNTLPGVEQQIKLYNVNHKAIDSLSVRTDSFGLFSGKFRLPQLCLSGYFEIESSSPGNRRHSLRFRVEEYKRPTYTVTTDPVLQVYALDDTLSISGTARTYTGLPVADALVSYRVNRSSWYSQGPAFVPQQGQVRTDAQGRFRFPVHLAVTEEDTLSSRYNRFFYQVSYTVSADNGENNEDSFILHAATRSARFETQIPDRVCKEYPPQFKVSLINAANQNVPCQASYVLTSEKQEKLHGTFQTGEAFSIEGLSALPSGIYALELSAGTQIEKDTVRFVLMSEKDVHVADRTQPFFDYSRTNATNDTAFVMVGTPIRDALLFYDLQSADRLIESRRYSLSDTLLTFTVPYRPEFGDGATAHFAMVHDGMLHQFKVFVKKPVPNKELKLRWTSFRSRLIPGQQEEWHLQVSHPDGTPAKANLMARMYDASLDAFNSREWQFTRLYFPRNLNPSHWNWQELDNRWRAPLSAYPVAGYSRPPVPVYACWRPDLFNYRYTDLRTSSDLSYNGLMPRSARMTTSLKNKEVGVGRVMAYAASSRMETQEVQSDGMSSASTGLIPRKNFAETAFFQPALRTNAEGEVHLSFTLPESMTRWNFTALAHDREMNHGRLDTTLIVRKEFMVQPALPRFVRLGDRTVLPVKVTNLSKSRITALLQFTLEDGMRSGHLVKDETRPFSLAAGETHVFNFSYLATDDVPLLVCRTVAAGAGFSDGEEHYLPVVSNLVEVTRSHPITLLDSGSYEIRVDTLFKAEKPLHRVLGVELSSNPAWYAVSALPVLADHRSSLSALEWGTTFYALSIGARIGELNPELRKRVRVDGDNLKALTQLKLERIDDSTPWLSSAENEMRRVAALSRLFNEEAYACLKFTALDKLKALQGADGSWSWYPGMKGNNRITLDVAVLLARVQRLADDYSATLMLRKAFTYLQGEVGKQVEAMKQTEKDKSVKVTPSDFHLRYLYLLTLMGERPDASATYLLDCSEALTKELTMYGKAVSAVVLAEFGKDEAARRNLKSLLEYTVYAPEKGRYFDTQRALTSASSYRIPTQCAAIEALNYFGEEQFASQMRLWLLQAKRTQLWETSQASTDAVYALLSGAGPTYSATALGQSDSLVYTLHKGEEIVGGQTADDSRARATLGYVKQRYTEEPAVSAEVLHIDKHQSGLSWGSVYATFTLPVYEVSTEGKELKMNRYFEYEENGVWKMLRPGHLLHKGNKVRQVFVVNAARDFDFVSLKVSRPACFEPVRPLSGYRYNRDFYAYCSVKDVGTDYFIEHLRKGTNLLTEEYFVDRSGQYSTGVSRIACEYAPEYSGTVGDLSLTIE